MRLRTIPKRFAIRAATRAAVLLGAALTYVTMRSRERRPYPPAQALLLSHPELEQPGRRITLQGGLNFRDVGGYTTTDGRRVRFGRLYRAGSLAELTEADLEVVHQLGLKLICDLRTPREAERAPDRLREAARAVYVSAPAYARNNYSDWLRTALFRRHELDEVIADGYLRMADHHSRELGGVLKRLADPEQLPALVHCTAGKDRTGVVVALLLSVLGVPQETILADYALSNADFERISHISRRDIQRMRRVGITENEIAAIMSANPLNLRRLFAHLAARYGSVEDYLLTAAGLSTGDLQRLGENFLN